MPTRPKTGLLLFFSGTGDTTRPTVAITSSETSPSAVLPVPITFTLSEASIDFAEADLTLVGCTVANFAGSGVSYTCEATPTAPNGTFTIDVAEDAFHDAAGNGNTAATQFSFTSSAFTLADEFTTNRAAGAVNGTDAEPTGGARTVADVESKITIASNALTFAAQATAAWGEEGIYYPSTARAAGKVLLGKINVTTPANHVWGWSTAANVALASLNHVNNFYISTDSVLNVGTSITVGTYATGTVYSYAIVLRASGAFMFFRGGAFTTWILLWANKSLTTTPLYPAITSTESVFTIDSIRLPTNAVTITPLASDNFTASDGALGNTRGGGSEEAGGSGLAWASQLGTWGIATNKAASSALDGGASISIATVPCGSPDVMAEVVATRSAGTSGLCLRYTDANNYIRAIHNGTNLQVIEVVAGTPNTLINTAVAYDAAARMVVSLRATKVRLYYTETQKGVEVTTAVTTGNNHGLFTDDTGATFDNFVIFAKGVGSEYEAILSKYLP
jgi:hypothetical protein